MKSVVLPPLARLFFALLPIAVSAQAPITPSPRAVEFLRGDSVERSVRIDAGLITFGGKVYRQSQTVGVSALNVRFTSPDGDFSLPWEKVPWNLRSKLEPEHAKAVAKYQALMEAKRRREELAARGLELIEGMIVGRSAGGMLVEELRGQRRVVLLRNHPEQTNMVDQDRVSSIARAGGTHEYSPGFFSPTKVVRVYDFVANEPAR